ncbi:MAG: hypothetical protein LBP89_02920 [Helicobacteraceae bacterium]|jgi:hypothetical protein|nr:hypothetical protein [Helicobacteraceae bacterium]
MVWFVGGIVALIEAFILNSWLIFLFALCCFGGFIMTKFKKALSEDAAIAARFSSAYLRSVGENATKKENKPKTEQKEQPNNDQPLNFSI